MESKSYQQLLNENERAMARLRDEAKSPEELIRIAELDGIITDEEAREVVRMHNEFVSRADYAINQWLGRNRSDRVVDSRPFQTRPRVPHRPEPLVLTVAGLEHIFEDIGSGNAWVRLPYRTRQRVTWLAIVVPAVIACLVELI